MALLGLSLAAPALQAQGARLTGVDLRSRRHVGIGYVASIPITPLGFTALGITPKLLGGAGVYADVKLTTSSPGSSPYYYSNLTVAGAEQAGHLQIERKSDWVTVDLALVYAITGEFAVYGGGGYSKETRYRQYFDQSQALGNFGFYYVSDPLGSGSRINALGGGFARLSRFLLFQFGVEANPTAANVGFSLTFAP